MKSRILASFVLVLVLGVGAPVFANDAEYGAHAGNPAPVKNDQIRMVSEDITFYARSRGGWRVTAIYVFENTTEKSVDLTMGFPEFKGDNSDEFLEFETKVRGKDVDLRLAEKSDTNALKSKGLGRVHLFDVSFAPKERLNVIHAYNYDGGGSVALAIETTIEYVTRTGALWKGPIGRATFTIRTNRVYELVALPEEFRVQSVRRFVIRKGEATGMELVFSMRDWTPAGDLHVDLVTDGDKALRARKVGECPEWGLKKGVKWRTFDDAPPAKKPDMMELEPLEKVSTESLRLCRNWVYARYGYPFKDEALRERFYGKIETGPYPPHYTMEGIEKASRKMIPLMPDPGFSTDMLTTVEMRYAELLRDEERARQKAAE